MFGLIWKEWHEQSWKLAFGCLVLAALALIGLRSRIVPDETMVMCVCFLGVILLPVLSATGLIPAERADSTLESFLSLPVSPARILAAKTAMGFLLCAGPMIIAALLTLLAAGDREMTVDAILILYARSVLASLSLFIWMVALTVHLPNETRAGLLAMGLAIFWSLATVGLQAMELASFWLLATVGLILPQVPPLFFALSPLSFVFGVVDARVKAPPLVVILVTQAVILIPLWFWTSKRLAAGVEGQS